MWAGPRIRARRLLRGELFNRLFDRTAMEKIDKRRARGSVASFDRATRNGSNASTMRDAPKVALLVETARGFGRELLRGVSRYVRSHGPWSIYIEPGDYEQAVPRMRQWGGTGIIARIPNRMVADAILEANLPTVAVGLTDAQRSPESPLSRFCDLRSDAKEVSRQAAEHLLERQLSYFAYVGFDERDWSSRREQAFQQRIEEAGYELHVYRQPKRKADRKWEREQSILARWIRDLPMPIGLFACNDDRGRQVLEACRLYDINVPGDVAVLGVDNDEVFCDLSDPPLSSIALNAEGAGFRAAELLDAMMCGKHAQPGEILVDAMGVVTRRSTEVVAVEDADVAAALQYIRQHCGRDISVNRVAYEVAISRRNLEKRFRKSLGCSILEEIQLARLERAKRLLLDTSYPISKVAELAGFGSTGYFIQFFQARVGKTPRRFRVDLTK
jgi:LacI family transcriptional regulator